MTHAPPQFPVAVVLEKHPPITQWTDASWRATGLVVNHDQDKGLQLIQKQGEVEQFIYKGLVIQLFADECESYYHNLKSPKPSCYVIADLADDGTPQPFITTLSFDEAHAYFEGNEEVYEMPIPAELYVWVEQFIIENYFPEKKTKRKLKDWDNKAGNIRA